MIVLGKITHEYVNTCYMNTFYSLHFTKKL